MKYLFLVLAFFSAMPVYAQFDAKVSGANQSAKEMTFEEIATLQQEVNERIPTGIVSFAEKQFSHIELFRKEQFLRLDQSVKEARSERNDIGLRNSPLRETPSSVEEYEENQKAPSATDRFNENMRWAWLTVLIGLLKGAALVMLSPIAFYVVSFAALFLFFKYLIKAFRATSEQ